MIPSRHFRRRLARPTARGFTLIELITVMVILAILAAVIVPKFTGRTEQAKETAAKAEIKSLKTAVDMFEADNQRFPPDLQSLVVRPGSADEFPHWRRTLNDDMKPDPWGHDYIYRCPGADGRDYDLFSCGPSGREGGPDNIR